MEQKLEFRDIFSALDDYDAILFDLWGVIVEGNLLYEGVIDNINKILDLKKVFFISNAPRSRLYSFDILKSWGLHVYPEMVFTSGQIALKMINFSEQILKIKNPIIYHLGSDRNSILSETSVQITENILEANILLLTLYRDEGEDLEEFNDILQIAATRNIVNICANPDTIIPKQDISRYCPGYFAKKIEQFGGSVIYTGKPHIEIYNDVLSEIPNIAKNRILMIGDTFETDILGANRVGIHSALVMTGNAKKFHIDYADRKEKLKHLQISASRAGVFPNFVTDLSRQN